MDYFEVSLTFPASNEYIGDILVAFLGELGYESFESTDNGLKAYIPQPLFNQDQLSQALQEWNKNSQIAYEVSLIKDQDWNAEWEKNVQPVFVGETCVIRPSFSPSFPEKKYEIIIDPKLAFGTGHHPTTVLMMEFLLEQELRGKKLLDMGCGTGVLSILASMMGAQSVTAIDIDEWAVNNTRKNFELNNVSNVKILQGDATAIPHDKFDLVLANINRNILIQDMHAYSNVLNRKGILILSGFYSEDKPLIESQATKFDLKILNFRSNNNWVSVIFGY
jgi:ribosomal protein L11 methyltransferase